MRKFERKEKSAPKHKPTASSGASKAPRPPPVQQPGWKGPTYIHKKAGRPKANASSALSSGAASPTKQLQALPVELQQLMLDVFRRVLPAAVDFEALKPTLQEINTALLERRFGAAFGTEAFREAYVIRWSPSRALCWANLLADALGGGVGEGLPWAANFLGGGGDMRKPSRAVCLGGGAAEVAAFGALLRHLKPEARGKPHVDKTESPEDHQATTPAVPEGEQDKASAQPLLHLTLVDSTNWASVVTKLELGLTTAPTLSKYASATARANNASLIKAEAMRVDFVQADVLASGLDELRGLIGPDAALVTMFFTLNELYTASIAKATKLLVEMTLAAPRDSLMLVVDSPGCFVEVPGSRKEEGEEGKRYSMAWLMDHLLLDTGRKTADEGDGEEEEDGGEQRGGGAKWEKLVGDECRLFRLEDRLEYPASLENMRFQVHLFRRL